MEERSDINVVYSFTGRTIMGYMEVVLLMIFIGIVCIVIGAVLLSKGMKN